MSATMPMGGSSGDRGRRMAVGLLVLAIVLVVAAIAIPVWLLNRHYSGALETNSGMLERYRRVAAVRPSAARDLELMRAHDARRLFLRSGAAALSAAEAQEALRSIIEANGGRLITMQAPSSRVDGRYRQVTVNVQLTANIVALRRILGAIESRTPYLFVDSLMVRSQVPSNFKPGPGAEPEMFVQFDVSGYSLEGAS
jgi:general secretion pathway protein M